jgi:PPM family protein phosphatase
MMGGEMGSMKERMLRGELYRVDEELTAEAAREHPYSSVLTRAIGSGPLAADVMTLEIDPGDLFLLCSDGLTGPVDESRIRALLLETRGLDDCARALVEAANAAGGPDNVTVVLARAWPSRAPAGG